MNEWLRQEDTCLKETRQSTEGDFEESHGYTESGYYFAGDRGTATPREDFSSFTLYG